MTFPVRRLHHHMVHHEIEAHYVGQRSYRDSHKSARLTKGKAARYALPPSRRTLTLSSPSYTIHRPLLALEWAAFGSLCSRKVAAFASGCLCTTSPSLPVAAFSWRAKDTWERKEAEMKTRWRAPATVMAAAAAVAMHFSSLKHLLTKWSRLTLSDRRLIYRFLLLVH